MTWNDYFQELGGVSSDIRATIRRIIPVCSTSARFEDWLHDFETDGVLARFIMQERDALESIGIVEALFDWMHKQRLHAEEARQEDGNEPDLYLTFDVTPELIQNFWQEQERKQTDNAPYLPGFCEVAP